MERTRKPDWLRTQGYRLSRLPFKVTWFTTDKVSGKEREFISRTDDYNLDLYRRKGYVLDRKFLDQQLWYELEYGVKRPVVTVEPPKHSGTTPKGHKDGCGREGFLARNSIGTVSPYRPW